MKLSVLLGVMLKDEQIEIYLEELEGLTQEQVDRAFKRLRQTWKPSAANPFPAICDILSSCGASPDDGLMLAITTVRGAVDSIGQYDSVCFCDRALHWVIRNFCGGWRCLCDWGDKDWDINMGRLVEAYREAKIKGLDGGNHLSGIFECAWNGRVSLRYIDVNNNSIKGEMRFDGKITAEGFAALDKLCDLNSRERMAIQSGGGAAVAQIGARI
jgi:hypothetical protein